MQELCLPIKFGQFQARAIVNTKTSSAPAAVKTDAHSDTVAPVVNTSSISSTRRPQICFGARTSNAPLTLSRRARASNPARCLSVCKMRTRLCSSMSTPVVRASARARTAAWLCPRSRSLFQCNGTGIIRFASEIGARRCAHVNARSSRRPTCGTRFRPNTDARKTPAYSPHARAAVKSCALQRPQRIMRRSSRTIAAVAAPHFQHNASSSANSFAPAQHASQTTPSCLDSTDSEHIAQPCGYISASAES